MHHLVEQLVELGLPVGDWALFGSGPLLLRGWIDEVGDLDVISRGQAWELARTLGSAVELDDGDVIIEIGDGITIGTSWAYGDFSIDRLINTAEVIHGIPCVQLEHIVAFKTLANRPKDGEHLRLIKAMTS